MAGKCLLVGAGKKLVDLRNRDRIIEKAHKGRAPEITALNNAGRSRVTQTRPMA
jgi:hypothetical protein